jgi:ATP-dependent Clp protease ATP-binding subunit ClpA
MLPIHKRNWSLCKIDGSIYVWTFLPDKAIDALDEAGSRVHITNEVPKQILDLERQLEDVRELKMW